MVNAGIIELVWLIVVTFAWTVGLFNCMLARQDAKKFEHSPVPVQAFMTSRIYYSSLIFCGIVSMIFIVCGWAIFHPPPPPSLWHLPQSWMNVCGWIVVSLGLAVYALLSMRWRLALSTGDYGDGGRRNGDKAVGIPAHDALRILKDKAQRMEGQIQRIEAQITERSNLTVAKLDTIQDTTHDIKEKVERVDEKLPPNGVSHD